MEANDNRPYCVLRHGRKSHTWGELRQAAQHTMRDLSVSWLGDNVDPARSHLNEVLVGSGDVVVDVRERLAMVSLEPKPGQVIARELLLTASSSYFAGGGHTGRDGDFDPDKVATWQDASLQFLRAEFGDNLATVVTHLDEAVPHMHAWATTAIHVERKSRGRPRKDGTKTATTTGWTLNHDKVMGSGKSAFTTRQDRYAEAMAPLGLQRGQRQSQSHHEPIRAYYARLQELAAKAEAERQMARDSRLSAEQDAIRQRVLRQAAEVAVVQVRQAEADLTTALDRVQGERAMVDDMKLQLRTFLDRRGLGQEFDLWDSDMKAIANLRRDKGAEWRAYETTLKSYAVDLKQFGGWRDAIVRRADRKLRYLLEAGAMALGHVSSLHSPARVVVDGVKSWLRLEGGDVLVRHHRTVVGWMREVWATMTDAAIEPTERTRVRER